MIRVPIYVQGPSVRARRIDQAASVMDLGPTILDLFGVSTPAHFMGQSFVPLLAGREMRFARPLVADSTSRHHARCMMFDGHIKAIEQVKSGTEEVYDLDADPGETNNLAETPEGQRHIASLREFFRIHTPAGAEGPESDVADIE
jgi:arylsulfatase A-like enzyme